MAVQCAHTVSGMISIICLLIIVIFASVINRLTDYYNRESEEEQDS